MRSADAVEREHYPAEPPGRALPFFRALIEGVKFALLALAVYLCALPFIFFAGLGIIIIVPGECLFARPANISSSPPCAFVRRPRPRRCARTNAAYIFLAGMAIALFVSIPLVNLATPIFAMAYMVHIHKRMSGKRVRVDRAGALTVSFSAADR